MVNKELLKKLADELTADNAEDKIYWQENYDKRLAELSKNLDDTIDYLNNCDKREFLCASEVFDELSEHFKSQRLIECVEKNVKRFNDERFIEDIKKELSYMKKNLQ